MEPHSLTMFYAVIVASFASEPPHRASESHFGDVIEGCSRNGGATLLRNMMKQSLISRLATKPPTLFLVSRKA